MFYILLYFYIPLANEFLTLDFVATYLFEAHSWPRRRGRLRSAGARSCGACFLRDLLLRHGDQKAQRYIENV